MAYFIPETQIDAPFMGRQFAIPQFVGTAVAPPQPPVTPQSNCYIPIGVIVDNLSTNDARVTSPTQIENGYLLDLVVRDVTANGEDTVVTTNIGINTVFTLSSKGFVLVEGHTYVIKWRPVKTGN